MTPNQLAGEAARTYQARDIEVADPLRLVVWVLDLASLHLSRARAALAAGDAAGKGQQISRVSRCIHLLQSNLDMEQGQDVAQNLDRIYTYLQTRLMEGHLRNDDATLGEIAGHLTELGSAWREISARQGHSAAPTPQPQAAAAP